MRQKELKTLKAGDIVYDKTYGFPFIVRSVNPVWRGFLTSKEIENRKPDSYYVTVTPVKGQDYMGVYKFENVYTFGAGLQLDSKKVRL